MTEPQAREPDPSPADARNDVIRAASWGQLTDTFDAPTPQRLVRYPGEQLDAPVLDPLDALRVYPQLVNAEWLTPMDTAIEAAIAAGDMSGVYTLAESITQGIGVELARRAKAAEGGVTPPAQVTTIVGAVVTDNSPADGVTANTVSFTATDQGGAPIVTGLVLTCDGTGSPVPTSGSTAADGTLAVNVTDTAAEAVTVTATSGTVSGTAPVTFV